MSDVFRSVHSTFIIHHSTFRPRCAPPTTFRRALQRRALASRPAPRGGAGRPHRARQRRRGLTFAQLERASAAGGGRAPRGGAAPGRPGRAPPPRLAAALGGLLGDARGGRGGGAGEHPPPARGPPRHPRRLRPPPGDRRPRRSPRRIFWRRRAAPCGPPRGRAGDRRRRAGRGVRPDPPRRLRLHAVLERHHGRAEGRRPPAPRHVGVLRHLRREGARDPPRRPLLQHREALLRVRAGERAVLPLPRRRVERPLPGSSGAGGGLRAGGPAPPHPLLRRPHRLRADARGDGARRGARGLLERAALRQRRRGAPRLDLRALEGAHRGWRSSTGSAPPRSATSSSRTAPAPAARAPAAPPCPATTSASWTTPARRCRRGRSATCWCAGDSTMALYWNKHEATKRTLQGEWIRTGDKYFRDEDGLLPARRPQRRHAEGGRDLGLSRGDRGRADRAPAGAGVRGGGPRGRATGW